MLTKEICTELERLSLRHPDLTVLEIIDIACDRQYPTRTHSMFTVGVSMMRTEPAWKLSNSDILKALKAYE